MALVGGIGYYVYSHAQAATQKALADAAAAAEAAAAAAAAEAAAKKLAEDAKSRPAPQPTSLDKWGSN